MAQVGKSQHSQPEWVSRILQGARSHKVLLAIVGSALIVVCGFAGVRIMNHSSTSSIIATTSSITARAGMPHTALTAPDSAEQPTSAAPPSSIWVHVDGAVAVPGVYEIAGAHPRCNDAVARAGGVTDDADTSAINLAAELHDGEKLHIPRSGETPAADAGGAYAPSGSSSVAAEQKTGSAGHDAGGTGSGAPNGSSQKGPQKININSASAEELNQLPGVGVSTAQTFVQDRTEHGPFSSVEDLMRVTGIGEKKFAKLQGRICV